MESAEDRGREGEGGTVGRETVRPGPLHLTGPDAVTTGDGSGRGRCDAGPCPPPGHPPLAALARTGREPRRLVVSPSAVGLGCVAAALALLLMLLAGGWYHFRRGRQPRDGAANQSSTADAPKPNSTASSDDISEEVGRSTPRRLSWAPEASESAPSSRTRRSSLRLSIVGLRNSIPGSPGYIAELDKTHRSWGSPRLNSIFEFRNITYTVGGTKNPKKILDDVSGSVRDGDMLAIMGPSGAGKTSLLKVLSLSATAGDVTGAVTLNEKPMTSRIFKEECYLVEQFDYHWPYLTCRETLMYAAQLLMGPGDHSRVVDDVVGKMGLESCQDTKVGNEFIQGLSGGQTRRLSVGIALLKKPSVIFLDEPTSGLDAAGAVAITSELKELAARESLIILSTIHQPSTKVYNHFDQVMILSKGREAYTGKASLAADYFGGIGYPMDELTNPAEFFIDLVNADFTSEEAVMEILREWHWHKVSKDEPEPRVIARRKSFYSTSKAHWFSEILVMFRRQGIMIVRDPMLYIGRAVIFLVANTFFAFVYWHARIRTQDQAINFIYANNWFISVTACMAVIAVYALNAEFKSVYREVKNGMLHPFSYIVSKSILVIPIMFVFALCGVGIPGYAIQNDYAPGFPMFICLFAVSIYAWECIAEMFSVATDNPLLGMLGFLFVWFGAFLFAGLFLAEYEIPWPLRVFYYVLPYAYSFPSFAYNNVIDDAWESCDPSTGAGPICIDFSLYPGKKPGALVLDAVHEIHPLFTSVDNRAVHMGILLALAAFFKAVYIILVLYRSSRSTVIKACTNPSGLYGSKE